MATNWNRLKARNCSKFNSKLNKIEGAITDGRIKVTQRSASRRVTLATGGTQENTESTEMGPSQMAEIVRKYIS